MLQEDETPIQVGIQTRKIVQEALLPQPLRQEEPGKGDVDKDAIVERFAQDATDEAVPVQTVGCGDKGD